MNLKTRYNFWKAKKSLSPEGSFRADLWNKMSASWDEKYGASENFWYQSNAFRFATATAAIVLLVGAGTGAYAYTSPQVTEGTPLYFVKKNLEKVEEKLQPTAEAKAKFYLKTIERREQEEKVLKVEGKKSEKAKEMIKQAENKLEKADKELEKAESKDLKLREKIKERLEKRLEARAEKDKQNNENQDKPDKSLKVDSSKDAGKINKDNKNNKERD